MRRWAALACGMALIFLASGCTPDGASGGAVSAQAEAVPEAAQIGQPVSTPYFEIMVNSVEEADRIVEDFVDEQAGPGNKYLILDVTMRNTDTEGRLFLEGELVAEHGGRELTFDSTETILADGYLLLETLNPLTTVRGKIVYKVPAELAGNFYWVPGRNSKRILLRMPSSQTQLQPAMEPVAGGEVDSARVSIPFIDEPSETALGPTDNVGIHLHRDQLDGVYFDDWYAIRASLEHAEPVVLQVESGGKSTSFTGFLTLNCATGTSAWANPRNFEEPVAEAELIDVVPGEVVSNARRIFCGALGEQPVHQEANDYAIEDSRPSFDCSLASTDAERLICSDSALGRLDLELAGAYKVARTQANNPTDLESEQAKWLDAVRDRCVTVDCMSAAYIQRISELSRGGGSTNGAGADSAPASSSMARPEPQREVEPDLLARYVFAMNGAIQSRWNRSSVPEGVGCRVSFTQVPGGEVIDVRFLECPYDGAARESVERALRTDALPYAGYEGVFRRDVTITFCTPSEAC